ncbi:hypothetical protein T552_02823 [Pneumocystis carinii B80]|uniref:ATP-dependent RNA helicase n=1 Tax=Pneumocystis carinii (strain B80) TaxID=1408658 RepID=A0A0W4ZD59_PNEC8|nr:hypothetical protein T552_02823 [Pneumocystis carinii B80]KTW26338.1 hypothetical protein T552_02823 [Pneumocystis carinii B80]
MMNDQRERKRKKVKRCEKEYYESFEPIFDELNEKSGEKRRENGGDRAKTKEIFDDEIDEEIEKDYGEKKEDNSDLECYLDFLPKWVSYPRKIGPDLRISVEEESIHLDKEFKERLRCRNYIELFPVQVVMLEIMLNDPCGVKGDFFISAVTGSGKTLAYTIPVVQMLSKRKIVRLRCIVIVPTKELVYQVRECFEYCIGGSGLKIGISTGQRSFMNEQSKLVGDLDHCFSGGQSLVDILICTPGRLVDHIQHTRNFSLQHLKYLIIDEADRLLSQKFQNWIEILMNEIELSKSYKDSHYKTVEDLPDAVNDSLKLIFKDDISMEKKRCSLQKFIFSATLTCNPEKIASLRLRNPQLILIQDSKSNLDQHFFKTKTFLQNNDISAFFVPPTLTEYVILVESNAKPLYLYHLIKSREMEGVLCFTKSNESASRLCILLNLIHQNLTSESLDSISDKLDSEFISKSFDSVELFGLFTSEVPKKQRNIALERFKNGDTKIFICSDLIARGIDLPQVFHVINYDIPQTSRQYIHRIGRTARAGKTGEAWTLYQEFESKKIHKILKNVGRKTEVIYEKMSETIFTNEYTMAYKLALKKLKKCIKGND